jgi:predicted alpha/beta-fold hydrolase
MVWHFAPHAAVIRRQFNPDDLLFEGTQYMLSLARLAALFSGLVFCASTLAADVDAESYGYPLANPFEATIATTPPELRPALPADADIRQRDYSVRLRPDRQFELLENFWPVTRLRYRLAEQKGRAPLIFIIAGTGAHYASGTNEYLKKLFYGAGFHVVQLSSPTSYDFMAAASRSATPGYSPEDADDLYRVMQAVRAQHPKLDVSKFMLTGYSLGALHAAFVSQLDETRRAFDFKRVLLLNPPVNLYTSITNLDKLVQTRYLLRALAELPQVTGTSSLFDAKNLKNIDDTISAP